MAYVMLVIGTVMSIAGAYAAITGYGIVQVEEGWASVIAGSTLFAGGVVTIGLGLVLRTLDQLKTSFTGAPAAALGEDPSAPQQPSSDANGADEQPMLLSPFATEALKSDLTGDADDPSETHGLDDGYKLETPSTPEHDLVSRPMTPSRPSRPSSDDWLDRAFADFDQDVPNSAPNRKSTTIGTKPAEQKAPPEPAPEPAFAATQADDAKTAALSASASPANPGSAVIGRYEADGTAYIMYADGSIEAQTHSGVYRFASMAELKAFIES